MCDMWWVDLPPKGKQAALEMGYTPESWDNDEDVPFDTNPLEECSLGEKMAAVYLGMNPLLHGPKLDVWWEDLHPETQQQGEVLGYDKEKWDDDWLIHDLPCEQLYWKDMTDEQKVAATYFGYMPAVWDETEDDPSGDFVVPNLETADDAEEEEVVVEPEDHGDDEEVDDPEEEEEAEVEEEEKKKKKKARRKMFKVSQMFGGDGGSPFNHGDSRHLQKLVIGADSHLVHSITAHYSDKDVVKSGGKGGKETTFELGDDEFIVKVSVRSNKYVQSLEFKTNKGSKLGPVGGSGWKLLGKDKPGTIHSVNATSGTQLSGFMGRNGRILDAIAFRFGPVPMKN